MIRTFKALSALLSYPSVELQEAIPAVRDVLKSEAIVSADALEAIEPLLAGFETGDIFGRGLCLSTCSSTFTAKAGTGAGRWLTFSKLTARRASI